jgi:tetratricopeptide (TPR) repeat protein
MARKRKPRGERPSRRQRRPAAEPDLPPLPDPRLLEGSLRRSVRELTGQDASTPLARAQDLLEQAYEEPSAARREALARQALALCPDCADAYLLLAEQAPNRRAALALYEQAVAAGEQAVGPDAFRDHVGHFWGILETRPYMRARLELALALWTTSRRGEAVDHLWELLRLNPRDNQGVRYTLANFLLFLDRDDDLARLLEQFSDDGMAAWAWTRALLAFRRQGDTPESRKLLKQAVRANRHVADYLLGRKHPPAEQPSGYSPGAESEALVYVQGGLATWKDTPVAIAWVRGNDEQVRKRKAAVGPPRGPLTAVKSWLQRHLASEEDVWQADARATPEALRLGGDKVRPWLLLVTSQTTGLVLAHAIMEEAPPAAALWDALVQAMQHPAAGEAHRPSELQVRPDERWESLRPHLPEIGVRLVARDDLPELDLVFGELLENLIGEGRPGLLDDPSVQPEQAAGFFAAAADFYRDRPWKRVGFEGAIRIECDRFGGGPWFAVLMGQSGLARGLALYYDLDTPQRIWATPDEEAKNALESTATSLIFGEETDLPLGDVEAARQHGWPVAGPEGWPEVMHVPGDGSYRRPLGSELELLEGCLRAIPPFLRRRGQDDLTPEELTVPSSAGPLKMALSWVPDTGA